MSHRPATSPCSHPSGILRALLHAAVALTLALAAMVQLPACGARSRLAPDAKAPGDFSLALSVDQAVPGGAAWYVLDADGALRIATGARRADSPVPPVARQLSPEQVELVWSQIRSSGLEQAVWDSPQSSESTIVDQGSIVFIAAGRARRSAAFASGDARIASTVSTLRTLAWIEESGIPRP